MTPEEARLVPRALTGGGGTLVCRQHKQVVVRDGELVMPHDRRIVTLAPIRMVDWRRRVLGPAKRRKTTWGPSTTGIEYGILVRCRPNDGGCWSRVTISTPLEWTR
jgi:hypothetical protein